MGKIHPQESAPAAPSYFTSKQETFTIWMKSLVMSGKGCTVFDSTGQIVYRVDNYSGRCRNEVHLMDIKGNVLFTIHRKNKFNLFGFWEGYRSTATDSGNTKTGFLVRKTVKNLFKGSSDSPCKVIMSLDKNLPYQYKIESWASKSLCKIVNRSGEIIAEVKRKLSTCGVVLGEDVLSMVVEPAMDHSLVMGLVVVYSLINRKM
ncbi:hypothetical protein Tsubulata_050196 [Turnera subulata]|uniref:Tubby C-terminal domain-containing protein n=1 Tax=Turnera subulata TaxID=218843 RepID=A0A9Q0J5N5_9ROSI|nr:hypothetical protein Tsubulata_050196 [Turnera subulata]